MKNILIVVFSMSLISCKSQSKVDYKDSWVCSDSAVYKGKKNHGKYHCTGQIIIRKYKDGKIDTVGWSFSGSKMFIDDEYEKYKLLSERGQYIIDSLKEDCIPYLQQSYLTYEPIYMKEGQKIEQFYDMFGGEIIIYYYKFHHTQKSQGIELVKEIKL